MSIISFFFQTRAKLGQMELDVSMSETHEATAQLTKNPVEDGGLPATDNVILDPFKLTIEGVVSRTPLGGVALLGSIATAAAGKFTPAGGPVNSAVLAGVASIGGLVAGAVAGGLAGPTSREPSDVWDYLLELWEQRIPFEVITALSGKTSKSHKFYENMIITHLTSPRNTANANLLRFTATLEQVRLVSTGVAFPLISAGPVKDAATKTANLGKQGATAAAAKTAERGSLTIEGLKYFGAVSPQP